MAIGDYLLQGSIHKVPYTGLDGRKYMFGIYRHVIDTTDTIGTDRLYLMYKDNGVFKIIGRYNFSSIKGGNEYSYDILNGTVFISSPGLHQYVNNSSAGVFYFNINEEGTFNSGFLSNSPAAEILIAAKNRLFISGKTVNYLYGGNLTFTYNSATVTSTLQATTYRARTSGVATLTLNVTAQQFNFKVGDMVDITLVGGTGYNATQTVLTAVDTTSKTISYANTGTDEGSTADTAGRVVINLKQTIRPGDMIMTAVPYSFTVSGISVAPVAGNTYTNNSSTFTVIRTNISTGSGTIYCTRSSGTNEPASSGNLSRDSGSGDASIAFSAVTLPSPISVVPGLWSEVLKVNDDNSITLKSVYTYYTSLIGAYIIKRVRRDIIYHSAEDPVSNWNISGQIGGDTSGFILSKRPVTGMYNYDDAVLIFDFEGGKYIEGTNISDWQTPENTKLPIGCNSQKSISTKNKWLGFFSKNGYYITKGGQFNFSDLQGEAYSEIIQRTMNDVDLDVASKFFAYIYKQFLFISVCSKSVYLSEEDPEQVFEGGTISCSTTTVARTSNYSAAQTSGNVAINCDTSSGNITITMPAASGNKAIFKITKTSASNNVYITGTGSNLVFGVPTYTMSSASGANVTIYSNGTNWIATNAYSTIITSLGIINRERTSNIATLTVASHNFSIGNKIYIASVGGTGYNGNYIVSSTTDTTISYVNSGSDESSTADTNGLIYPAWIGNVVPNDLLKIGNNYYNITEIVDNTTLIINELITDLTNSDYTIVKRRNNRLLVLDTRTNVRKQNYAWTIFDNVNVDSFCELEQELYYASSTSSKIYKYDTGGQLYGAAFTAYFKTRKEDCGLKGIAKFFKYIHVKCKGIGRLYITPYVNDIALDEMCIDVNNDYYESFYFPNANNPDATVTNYPKNSFSGIGETIQLYFELNGSDETLAILPPEIGYLPLSRRKI